MGIAEDYWNRLYSESPFKSGKEPSSFLVQMLPRLHKGKVLDIGMGEGRQAVYLAQHGFKVKGLDVSTSAVEHAKQLAKDTGVTIDAQKADLDLFLFGLMEYDTVVMFNFRPAIKRYYTEIIRTLKQGGTLLVESLTTEEIKDIIPNEESFRNFYYGSNELLHNINGLRILFYQEGLVDGTHKVQCLAQKPFEKDALKYKLFDMHTKQADPQKSNQLKLAESFFKNKNDSKT